MRKVVQGEYGLVYHKTHGFGYYDDDDINKTCVVYFEKDGYEGYRMVKLFALHCFEFNNGSRVVTKEDFTEHLFQQINKFNTRS